MCSTIFFQFHGRNWLSFSNFTKHLMTSQEKQRPIIEKALLCCSARRQKIVNNYWWFHNVPFDSHLIFKSDGKLNDNFRNWKIMWFSVNAVSKTTIIIIACVTKAFCVCLEANNSFSINLSRKNFSATNVTFSHDAKWKMMNGEKEKYWIKFHARLPLRGRLDVRISGNYSWTCHKSQ